MSTEGYIIEEASPMDTSSLPRTEEEAPLDDFDMDSADNVDKDSADKVDKDDDNSEDVDDASSSLPEGSHNERTKSDVYRLYLWNFWFAAPIDIVDSIRLNRLKLFK